MTIVEGFNPSRKRLSLRMVEELNTASRRQIEAFSKLGLLLEFGAYEMGIEFKMLPRKPKRISLIQVLQRSQQ